MEDKQADTSDMTDFEEPASPKKKKYSKSKQKYRKCWENEYEFKGWLQIGRSEYEASCTLCNIYMQSQLHVIRNHSKSIGHQKHCASTSRSTGIPQYFKPVDKPSKLEEDVRKAEIKLCAFIAEHNVAFSVATHLILILQQCFPDSRIAQNISLGRTKATAIVKNVLGKDFKTNLVQKLMKTKFSILTDESTDISNEKTSCVIVRYFDSITQKIVSSFWELTQVFSDDKCTNEGATAENLFNSIKRSFDQHNIPYENIVGFGSDGCNVMMGSKNSVSTRFIELCPGIAIMKCICHSAHLIASEACKSLPRRCEDLARNIFNIINGSSKRMHQLKQFQEFVNVDVHRLLHPAQTRWLSLNIVVTRIIEQWDALKLFFNDQWLVQRLVAAENVFNDLNDPFIKLYFYFLEWILPKFTSFNQYFQSEQVIVTDLNSKITELYKEILLLYMNPNYVLQNDINDIDPKNCDEFIVKSNIYLGVKVMQEKEKACVRQSPQNLNEFYTNCQRFFIIACCEIKKRFNFNDPKLIFLSALKPENALSFQKHTMMPSLIPLMKTFPRLISENNTDLMQKIDDQWRKLPHSTLPEDIKKSLEYTDVFWAKLHGYKNVVSEYEFKELSQFVLDILVIPHSNAQCERVFSKVNLIKTKVRNKLITETVNGILLAAESVKSSGDCTTFHVTNNLIKKHNVNMYDHKNTNDDDVTIDSLVVM